MPRNLTSACHAHCLLPVAVLLYICLACLAGATSATAASDNGRADLESRHGTWATATISGSGGDVPSEPLELIYAQAKASKARVTLTNQPGERFTIDFDASTDTYPEVTFPLAEAPRDLSAWPAIAVDVTNPGKEEVMIIGFAGTSLKMDGCVYVQPGATETLWAFLRYPGGGDSAYAAKYPGMLGRPGDWMFASRSGDPKSISSFTLRSAEPHRRERIAVSRMRLSCYHPRPEIDPLSGAFFPFVDEYGQYRYREWPGKVHSKNDLAAAIKAEDRDLAAHPGPANRDQYGGWAKGPQLKATGHFRTEKVDGRWWLVDPDGRLFWSAGCDVIKFDVATTLVTGREKMFSWLPEQGDPQFGAFARQGSVNFSAINLKRKFGTDWEPVALDRTLQRMLSWGMNTIGNWSDPRLMWMHRTPYTAGLQHYRYPMLGEKLPNASNPEFRKNVRAALEQLAKDTADDPWCIGYFVDNELTWPQTNGGPNAELYFRIVREEVKRVAPNKLYLGARFDMSNWPEYERRHGEDVIAASARWCDVVSFNRYRFNPGRLCLTAGFDKPIIIGEFHFGALDRGMRSIGVHGVGTQPKRARAYIHYVRECLDNPAIVGAHWFCFQDQALTGRGDGENYQIGLVDVCDTPYPETIAALREVHGNMYEYRAGHGHAK